MKTKIKLMIGAFFCTLHVSFCQDILQKTDNTTIACKVVEVSETKIFYKSWDYLNGPNRSIEKNQVVKIIYEDGKIEFMQSQQVQLIPNGSTVIPSTTPNNQTTSNSYSPKVEPKIENKEKIPELEYQPNRIAYGFNSAGYSSLGYDFEFRVTDYLNFGLGAWTHIPSQDIDYTFSSLRLYLSGYLPVNKVLGKDKKINRGFFPFFQPGYDMMVQFPEDGGIYYSGAFIWKIGTDYNFGDKFGITYSYSNGNMNNIGISFSW